MEDLVNKLRCYAEDLHPRFGFNRYASAISQAADEIVKMREYIAMMDADMIATIEQRVAAERAACAAICEGYYDTLHAARAIRERGGE